MAAKPKRRTGLISTVLKICFVLAVFSRMDQAVDAADASKMHAIATLVIMTEDGKEPTCEYVPVPPENCWGSTICNNEYVSCRMEYYDSENECTVIDADAKIKLRGNSSMYHTEKKPYKLKLSKKQAFSTDEKSKKWILLKTGTDLNFLFSNWTASYCGMQWQPQFEYVNLIVNSDYKGCYVLAESVENISKSTNFSDSGFLVENNAYWWIADQFFKVNNQRYQLGFTFKEPDSDKLTDNQTEAIKMKINTAVDHIQTDDESYTEYVDVESFASWFLAKDYMCSWDSGGSNMYWYSWDSNDVLHLGPIWDYDCDYTGNISAWSSIHNSVNNFGNYLFQKESFKSAYKQQYEKTKDINEALTIYINHYLDTYGSSLQESWERDAERWDNTPCVVNNEKERLLNWYTERNEWIGNAVIDWGIAAPSESGTETQPLSTSFETSAATAQTSTTDMVPTSSATEPTVTAMTTTAATCIHSSSNKQIVNDADLCKWAVKDYADKTGQKDAVAEITSKSEDEYKITLKDINGKVVDVYTIDPATAVGFDLKSNEVNLPNTGNHEKHEQGIIIFAFLSILAGTPLLIRSDVIRRKNEQ